ncbi:NAD(P)-binding protein [Coprinellus micaceus]|uniref:NAD(P)-binding protein n=1 Tax=Coprinellus micaceus TaxID=71717 RepID=A0A4Y7SFR9_COPMI|nr:NAD(P)-binding protein [Coprinellus micaceus]
MAPPSSTGMDKILSSPQTPHREIYNLFSLLGRVALVTGANQGIGLEIAEAYAEAGATVYCLDLARTPSTEFKTLEAYVASLPELPETYYPGYRGVGNRISDSLGEGEPTKGTRERKGTLVYVQGDVTKQEKMWDTVARIVEVEGRLDVCVANAGILAGFEAADYPEEDWSKLLNVNVNGVMYTAQAAARQMKKLGIPGSIILTASMSGSITNKDHHWAAYNTSKAAVIQMGRSLACEWGKDGIRVNTVSPGYIYSKMTKQFLDTQPGLKEKWAAENPLGRIGETQELRGAYLWLAADGSTFCTGSDIIVDGGHRAW